ncbi:MAG: bifunctional glutamate N-acetyltransferase/amino-acid acetyltransferase ArgJ [Thermodesulfobacteriota bacterium]
MCRGFKAAGIAAGIKKNGKKDLGILVSETPATVAGVFTKNRVQAAPVRIDRQRLQGGVCRAVIANSGNANCCTGEKGMTDALAMGRFVSEALSVDEDAVMVASTGVIGQPLPIETVGAAMPQLLACLSEEKMADFAESILTTDTHAKVVTRCADTDGKRFCVTGVAKGAGMIRPDMATMLCFVCTDIGIDQAALQQALNAANDRSFNRITIDGDTSTNDTVLVLANGMSGVRADNPERLTRFREVLDEVLMALAKMIVKDAEGATKCVEISVTNAVSEADARQVADTVAHSNLVKTALFGEDANWGRIIAAMGRAGVAFDPEAVDIDFGEVRMVENGMGCGDAAEEKAAAVLRRPEFTIRMDVKAGKASASVLTCDFSVDYVKINADYRT